MTETIMGGGCPEYQKVSLSDYILKGFMDDYECHDGSSEFLDVERVREHVRALRNFIEKDSRKRFSKKAIIDRIDLIFGEILTGEMTAQGFRKEIEKAGLVGEEFK